MMEKLPQDVLVGIMGLLDAKDLRAMSIVSHYMNSIIMEDGVWESLFRFYWNRINFYMESKMKIELSLPLQRMFPRDRRSDAFRFLVHSVQEVPSFADICLTNSHATSSVTEHRIEPLAYDNGQVVTMALAKGIVGGNRCVRANVPFQEAPRVAVYNTGTGTWFVDVVYDGYFEISISEPHFPVRDPSSDMCVAIGVASSEFEVVDQQPGWDDHSYGYHSDDGNFFTGGQPHRFANTFGVNETIGCGVARRVGSDTSEIYFTKNGVRLDKTFPCCYSELFPVVGIDADFTVRLNCGRTPFEYKPSNTAGKEALEELSALQWPKHKTTPKGPLETFLTHAQTIFHQAALMMTF